MLFVLTTGFLVWRRYQQNPETITPYPYEFKQPPTSLKLEAPILIVGDRMGEYFSKFQINLAEIISTNLSTPIKIFSLAQSGKGLNRTVHELKALSPWPQVIIYQGGSEEFDEPKLFLEEIDKIKQNFSLFKNDNIRTLITLYPKLSRLIYEPVRKINLPPTPERKNLNQEDYLKRLETELNLFELLLTEMVELSIQRNTLLILTTTPLDLNSPPKSSCPFTITTQLTSELDQLKFLLTEDNPKQAYGLSNKMISKHSANADLFYWHGQAARRLGLIEEAKKYLKMASSFDCGAWRSTEVMNSIIRKVARENRIALFDFAKLVENEYNSNEDFIDGIYPPSIYYNQATKQLGLIIKNILKL